MVLFQQGHSSIFDFNDLYFIFFYSKAIIHLRFGGFAVEKIFQDKNDHNFR